MNNQDNNMYDCIIIGGGPTGLLASVYLRRFRRTVALLDEGKSRVLSISLSHNYPGYAKGVAGGVILSDLKQQAAHYGVTPVKTTVNAIQVADWGFLVTTNETKYHSKMLILATGVNNIEPPLPNVTDPVLNGLIHHCLICDGYEAIDKKIAILASDETAVDEAVGLSTYSKDITLLTLGKSIRFSPENQKKLKNYGFKIIEKPITEVITQHNCITGFRFDQQIEYFEKIYTALGIQPNTHLAKLLKIKLNKDGCIITNAEQCTSMQGIYAIGDVTAKLDQICVGFAQAATAATDIHNKLKELEAKGLP